MNEELASNKPSQSLLQLIDVICDRFEHAWLKGERPRIEDYLREVEASEQVLLLRKLLKVEVEYRSNAKEEITLEHYQERFPLHAEFVATLVRECGPVSAAPISAAASSPEEVSASPTHGVNPPDDFLSEASSSEEPVPSTVAYQPEGRVLTGNQ